MIRESEGYSVSFRMIVSLPEYRGGIRMKRHLLLRNLCFLALIAAVVAAAGCSPSPRPEPPDSGRSPSAGPSPSVTQSAATAGNSAAPSSQDVPTGGSTPFAVSEASLAYARSIGGKNHQGQSLYFIIGKSVASENEAQAALKKALPLFGDMQSYFIVQRTESFEGMTPGWWVVAEAYRKKPSQENLNLARRAFPDAYVKTAVVRASSPIPVYEDLVGK